MIRIFKLLLIVLIPFISSQLFAQTRIDWINLADVTFEEKQMAAIELTYNHATFGESLKALAGQEISITGYMIPMDPMGITFVLSRNPNATCFFCGGAGPETVMQIKVKPGKFKRYTVDDRLTFKGILRMYEKDIDSLTYVLEDAEEM